MLLRQSPSLFWDARGCAALLLRRVQARGHGCHQTSEMLLCGRARPYFGMPEDSRASCCSKCKLEGMVDIRNPKCSVCGKRAAYPDAAGKPWQLCAAHSSAVGAHVLSSPCWSRAASDCFDLLEEERGSNFSSFRQWFDEAAGTWFGKEFAGLERMRPDAHDPQRREVVKFLGNYYHGFPPKHPEQLGSRKQSRRKQASSIFLGLLCNAQL